MPKLKTEMGIAEKDILQNEGRKNTKKKKLRRKGTLGKQMARLGCWTTHIRWSHLRK
jgi:hypothetical protein